MLLTVLLPAISFSQNKVGGFKDDVYKMSARPKKYAHVGPFEDLHFSNITNTNTYIGSNLCVWKNGLPSVFDPSMKS